ncbi:TIGR01777 family oxidoreductase [Francisella adeliensis]|uniref:TIGR01777 family protein n=1 Tax=Francisella adeliensis TaxID=2007306 RepID=A0A2Z4XXU6_9GAMM|nr:TIGR01777 family oxidoreductase [Francisella adeliensis]AXA33243.1 TIGR01777 family protein [Francisella adeliensis]MBK2085036.1 TIGR01777 family protein [Francisella adeliensis]MBK2096973.1 TIGR01777 family protein [Francisella adeliensis]QIW11469.1 TIGR01777 family protein [Francisella adeliensis]QIW13344.1 TIGR01777 family protein [Francisella adeliensis]
MKILIAGGSGFVGANLAKALSEKYSLTLLSRTKQNIKGYQNTIVWQDLNEYNISNFDIVINLCGYSIGEKRWNDKVKDKIISSRIEPTQKLIELIGDKDIWLINASAIGFYGFSTKPQNEDEYFDNTTEQGFSQSIVNQWEATVKSSKLQKYSILRFGVVIGDGGVLDKMTMTAKLGVLSKFGNGEQLMSWISIHDLVKAFEFVIENNHSKYQTFNLTAPNATSNSDMIKVIKQLTKAKLVMPMPEIMIKLMFGQMGEELLLSSQNIKPKRLLGNGFRFDDDNIEKALERYL